ncbi:hypothetical protein [Actinophytocola sp.]|jgi:hypothetical protein|uniref:hypothetical protein n=1 Tax=Actinophytocola sp. TaxID=1872138 RepID=UPI002EDAE6E4
MARPAGHDDEHLPDHFLVDGVAPSVIGGADGPDLAEDDARYEHEPRPYRDPPTAPIPAQSPPEERKSWLGRMFGR